MPREFISMTPEEIVEFVSGETRCIVATLDPDGSPWGDAAACLYRDGRLYFRVAEGSRSARNLRGDPRVCCTLESMHSVYYSAIAAMVHGRAVAVADAASLPELQARPDPVTKTPIAGPVFSVDLDNVVSFDFSKINRRFEQDPR